LSSHEDHWIKCGNGSNDFPSFQIKFRVLENGQLEKLVDEQETTLLEESNSTRLLAGLTKKAGNRLGSPAEVITESWLISPLKTFIKEPSSSQSNQIVKPFNPLLWYVIVQLSHITLYYRRRFDFFYTTVIILIFSYPMELPYPYTNYLSLANVSVSFYNNNNIYIS
jgi:hypothetical protein